MKNIARPSRLITNRDAPMKNGPSGFHDFGSTANQIKEMMIDAIPMIRAIRLVFFRIFIAL